MSTSDNQIAMPVATRVFVAILTLLVLSVAGVQFYRSKTSGLTPWKGGGFGMYTAPYYTDRSVWLSTEYESGSVVFRLWPADARWHTLAEDQQALLERFLTPLLNDIRAIRPYPRDSLASKLLHTFGSGESATRLNNGFLQSSDVGYLDQKIVSLELSVHRSLFDLDEFEIRNEVSYRYSINLNESSP